MSVSVPKMPVNKKVKLLLTFLVPLVIILIPTGETLTWPVKFFFAITVCAILMFAFELMHNFAPALLLPVAYIVFKVAPASVAFSPWLVSTPWVALSSFLIIGVAARIGLLDRLTYRILVWTGGTYKGILVGIFLTGLAVNLFMVGFGMMPLILSAYSICVSLNLQGTKSAAGIMLMGCMAGSGVSVIYYSPQLMGFLINLFQGTFEFNMTWFKYFSHNIIFLLLFILLGLLLYFMYKPEKDLQGSAFFKEKLAQCGPMSMDEKKMAGLIIFLFLWMVTSSWHKMGMEWGFLIVAALAFFPGVNIAKDEDLKSINITFVLFMVACFSIGNVATALGLGQTIAQLILPYVHSSSPMMYCAITYVLCLILNFFMTPFAILATLSLPLSQLGAQLGINPLVACYAIFQGMEAVFLPYEATQWLFVYSFGMISMSQFIKFSTIKVAISFAFLLFIAVPYWHLIGVF